MLTVTVIVAPMAHEPTFGVNVYVVVAFVFTTGDQVPVTLLLDVVGSVKETPWQTGLICVKLAVTEGFTVTVTGTRKVPGQTPT